MKKEIKIVDEEKGIIRVTTTDERWYSIPSTDENTKLPTYKFIPSVTWIAGFYPKGVQFYKWLAQKGWDEAEAIKSAAGDKGSKVHHAIEDLIAGKELTAEDKYWNNSTEQDEELTTEEWGCIIAFAKWVEEFKPEFLMSEVIAINEELGYAGTVDCVAKVKEDVYIIDFKTGQYIWPEYELQISAYKHAIKSKVEPKLAFLQVGYKRNKKGYKFTEVEDKFELFKHAMAIWKNENKAEGPKQYELPMKVSLPKKKAVKVEKESKKDTPSVSKTNKPKVKKDVA